MSELLSKDEIQAIDARANNSPKFNAETYSQDLNRLLAHCQALEAQLDGEKTSHALTLAQQNEEQREAVETFRLRVIEAVRAEIRMLRHKQQRINREPSLSIKAEHFGEIVALLQSLPKQESKNGY